MLHSDPETRGLTWRILSSFFDHINKVEDKEKQENLSSRFFELLKHRITYIKDHRISYEDIVKLITFLLHIVL